jgi:penicillin-binding protein 1C
MHKFFSSRPELIRKLLLGFIVLVAAFILVSAVTILAFSKNLPTREQILNREVTQSTKIYDRTGEILLYEISGGERRTVVSLDQIPQFVQDATLAMEDQNFYHEGAVSVSGILRAVFVDLTRGGVVQGGSTITQQLAKNAFLTQERTWSRKIKELLLAFRLDQEYSKDQILELYFNEIPYGPTTYGIESASVSYFGKPVKDLSLAQGAVLVSIPKSPVYYSPWGTHTNDLLTRQKLVLQTMYKAGKINESQLNQALSEKIAFATPKPNGILAPHFVMAVEDYLVSRYGEDVVRGGGLKVITTLNMDMQTAAERQVAIGAANNAKNYGGTNAALVAEDPKTGQILAMVGSKDYFDTQNQGNFNVATQGLRQPGSTLKPFVYMTGFQEGYTPQTMLFDVPTEFSGDSSCPAVPVYTSTNKKCFHPKDFEPFLGPVSVRTALAQSVNIAAVKMLYLVGLKDALQTMNDFGLKTLDNPNQYGLSLTLGGGAVHLYDLVGAYSGLAEDGLLHEQTVVLEVQGPKGNLLETYEDKSQQVFDENQVRKINDILSDVNARSGLFGGSINQTVFPGYDVALKTGTSNDYVDAWSMGFTPNLVVGVWAGNNNNSPMHKQGSSILAAVPIWSAFMRDVIAKTQPDTFQKPDISLPDKPLLRGEYVINGQVHSELYWINKDDPTGPPPANPASDPQFTNWETGVQNWFSNYPVNTGENPNGGGSPSGPAPVVQIKSPSPGQSVGNNNILAVNVSISGQPSITAIKILWNGSSVGEFTGDYGPSYELNWSFVPSGVNSDNILEVDATSETGAIGKSSVTVYH